MTAKRFTFADGFKIVAIKDNGQIMNSREVCELLNELHEQKQNLQRRCGAMQEEIEILSEENEELKEKLKKYEEIEELKKEAFVNCHNCKNDRSVHDGVTLDGMCAIDELMNIGGYFDTEYHRLPSGTLCPCWELEE